MSRASQAEDLSPSRLQCLIFPARLVALGQRYAAVSQAPRGLLRHLVSLPLERRRGGRGGAWLEGGRPNDFTP